MFCIIAGGGGSSGQRARGRRSPNSVQSYYIAETLCDVYPDFLHLHVAVLLTAVLSLTGNSAMPEASRNLFRKNGLRSARGSQGVCDLAVGRPLWRLCCLGRSRGFDGCCRGYGRLTDSRFSS